jgi:mono/diheme cytochrome c family protein
MFSRSAIFLGIAGLFLGVYFIGQGTGITQTKDKTLKQAPISQSQPNSGKQMFQDYCAACHGMDGKGTGPAVTFLKVPPPDLTTIAKRGNMTSVATPVREVLLFGTGRTAHGTIDMPLWGPMFRSLNNNPNNGMVEIRIRNLADFVQSIQQN